MDMAFVEVYDILGKKVYEASHFCKIGMNKFTVLPKNLAKGMYTVSLSLNGKTKNVKMIKN